MKRKLTLAGCLLLSLGGLTCTWYLEREAKAVRGETENTRLAIARGQAHFAERYRTEREHQLDLADEFDRRKVWHQAAMNPHLHLRVDLSEQQLFLVSDGFVLRKISLLEESARGAKVSQRSSRLRDMKRGAYVVGSKLQDEAILSTDWWSRSEADAMGERPDLSGARYLEMTDGSILVGGAQMASAHAVMKDVIALPQVDISAIYGAVDPGTQVYVY